jgi:hypothetical protein
MHLTVSLIYNTQRNEVLGAVARELEFAAHSMCVTEEWYGARTGEKERAVETLRGEVCLDVDGEVDEDARAVVEVFERACRGVRKGKGKMRA